VALRLTNHESLETTLPGGAGQGKLIAVLKRIDAPPAAVAPPSGTGQVLIASSSAARPVVATASEQSLGSQPVTNGPPAAPSLSRTPTPAMGLALEKGSIYSF